MYDNADRVEETDHAGQMALTAIRLKKTGQVVAKYPSVDGMRTVYGLPLPASTWLLIDVLHDFSNWTTARYHSEGNWIADKNAVVKQALMLLANE
jgi:hypothetical protein